MSTSRGRATSRSSAAGKAGAPRKRESQELSALLLALGADVAEPKRILKAAQRRADAVARAASEGGDAAGPLAGTALAGYALAAPLPESAVAALVAALARTDGSSEAATRVDLFVRALSELAHADVAPRVALDAELRLLAALAPAAGVSLWVGERRPTLAVAMGKAPPPDDPAGADLALVPLEGAAAVLAAVPRSPADRAACVAYLELAAPPARVLVLRERRLEQETAGGAALARTSERRLLRLGFDLHDGALQTVVALAADLRLFRAQLRSVLGDEHTDIVLGRVDDLEARLVELERELRELAESLQPEALVARPLAEAVRAEVEAAGVRSAIATTLTVDGAFEGTTASQRLVVLRVLQEALTNAREHGRASRVDVALSESRDGLRLEVKDNGRGFSVEALEQAERRGSLGVAGMRQRVALLGGAFAIESRPGGPTTVSARLPRWTPLSADS